MKANTVRNQSVNNTIKVVTDDKQVKVVQPTTRVVEVLTVGVQGPPGTTATSSVNVNMFLSSSEFYTFTSSFTASATAFGDQNTIQFKSGSGLFSTPSMSYVSNSLHLTGHDTGDNAVPVIVIDTKRGPGLVVGGGINSLLDTGLFVYDDTSLTPLVSYDAETDTYSLIGDVLQSMHSHISGSDSYGIVNTYLARGNFHIMDGYISVPLGFVSASSFTGSLFGTASYALSASQAITASYAPNYVLNSTTASFATTGSNSFNGNQEITGSITVTGSIVADNLMYRWTLYNVDLSAGGVHDIVPITPNHRFVPIFGYVESLLGTIEEAVGSTFSGAAFSIGVDSNVALLLSTPYTAAGTAYEVGILQKGAVSPVGGVSIDVSTEAIKVYVSSGTGIVNITLFGYLRKIL